MYEIKFYFKASENFEIVVKIIKQTMASKIYKTHNFFLKLKFFSEKKRKHFHNKKHSKK